MWAYNVQSIPCTIRHSPNYPVLHHTVLTHACNVYKYEQWSKVDGLISFSRTQSFSYRGIMEGKRKDGHKLWQSPLATHELHDAPGSEIIPSCC